MRRQRQLEDSYPTQSHHDLPDLLWPPIRVSFTNNSTRRGVTQLISRTLNSSHLNFPLQQASLADETQCPVRTAFLYHKRIIAQQRG